MRDMLNELAGAQPFRTDAWEAPSDSSAPFANSDHYDRARQNVAELFASHSQAPHLPPPVAPSFAVPRAAWLQQNMQNLAPNGGQASYLPPPAPVAPPPSANVPAPGHSRPANQLAHLGIRDDDSLMQPYGDPQMEGMRQMLLMQGLIMRGGPSIALSAAPAIGQ